MTFSNITDNLKIYTKGSMEKFRHDTFFTKEPETLAWIESLFQDGDVFYDIGANIGVYTLYAASLYPKMQVISFEPFVTNYLRLCENIQLNGFENITPLLMGLSDQTKIDTLFVKDETLGSSGHQISKSIDEWGNEFEATRKLHVLTDSLDTFISHYQTSLPNHIKIDVDGVEWAIIKGMKNTISQPDVKSVLVEVNQSTTNMDEVNQLFKDAGFHTDSELNRLENHSRHRRKGTQWDDVENVIYVKGD